MQSGTNWYIYCSNNPMNRVDPTGLWDLNPLNIFQNMLQHSGGSGKLLNLNIEAAKGNRNAQNMTNQIMKESAIEVGIKTSENLGHAGNGMVAVGTASGNPAIAGAGVVAGTASDVSNLIFTGLKADHTGLDSDKMIHKENMINKISGFIVGAFAGDLFENIRKTNKIPILNKFLRNFTNKTVGKFSKKVIDTGKKVIGHIASETTKKATNEIQQMKKDKDKK